MLLWCVIGRYGPLRRIMGNYGALWCVTMRDGALWGVSARYGALDSDLGVIGCRLFNNLN